MTERVRKATRIPARRGSGTAARRTATALSRAARPGTGYDALIGGIAHLLEEARRASARAVNALMTATYWEIGRRIVKYEQGGRERAEYGERLIERLSADLSARFGRGFSPDNLENMRRFYLAYRAAEISETVSRKSGAGKPETLSRKSGVPPVPRSLHDLANRFPLPWSAYVRLLSVRSDEARHFYEAEALRRGWASASYGRTRCSAYAFVSRRRRPSPDGRSPRTLPTEPVPLTWSRSGQPSQNPVSERRSCVPQVVGPDENPPVGLILCAQKNEALARYALDNLPNKVLAAEYRTVLPDEKLLAAEIAETRRRLEAQAMRGGKR